MKLYEELVWIRRRVRLLWLSCLAKFRSEPHPYPDMVELMVAMSGMSFNADVEVSSSSHQKLEGEDGCLRV